jgi:iron(II)-dependent oxidoreductase
MSTSAVALDRERLIGLYRRNRERSRTIFDLLVDDAYYSQPIALRHPIVFYEGHLPAFSFNTLVKRGLHRASIDPYLETLFARGIDPDESQQADRKASAQELWPTRALVQEFAAEADQQVLDALAHGDIDRPGDPLLDRAEAAFSILEHEAMHQETLLYMWHRLPFNQKHKPPGYGVVADGRLPRQEWTAVAPGTARLGVDRTDLEFSWDNEQPARVVDVAAFELNQHDVTNAAFMEFVDAGGYADARWWLPEDWSWVSNEHVRHPLFWERQDDAWYWRGMFELIRLPLSWPVYVSHAEAAAFARWRGVRLPTEAEFQRAAYGSPDGSERSHPWGDAPPTLEHGVFDFSSWDPHPAGSHPAGQSAWGIDDLVGNGWKWTSTVFEPFPGFRVIPSYPEYSADFFDGEHRVMKGASPATARELLRPTFRNWFRPRYPYVYATFRCARDRG